jgi:hypothetical protein
MILVIAISPQAVQLTVVLPLLELADGARGGGGLDVVLGARLLVRRRRGSVRRGLLLALRHGRLSLGFAGFEECVGWSDSKQFERC